MSPINLNAEAGAIPPEEIWQAVERILQSHHFRHAANVQEFLRYVIRKSLAGETSDLKEYAIGVEVFQRGKDYDPARDSIVRVQASLLRKKLAGYYQEEGQADEVRIALPRGHYLPEFKRQINADSASTPVLAELPSKYWYQVRGGKLLQLSATFVLGLLAALLLPRAWTRGSDAPAPSGARGLINPATESIALPLWDKFLNAETTAVLAYGVPQFFRNGNLFVREIGNDSPTEIKPGSRLMTIQNDLKLPLTPTEVYTGVGELNGVYWLSRFFAEHARPLRLARSRLVGWEAVKNDNVIFLSALRWNTLAKDLAYRSDFVFTEGRPPRLVNRRPLAGEQAEYVLSVDADGGDDYATITLWPGKAPQRRILSLGGLHTWGTEAAAEYITKPEYLRQLNSHLAQCAQAKGQGRHAPYLQILLRVEIKDSQPVAIHYVTHHDLEIKAGEPENNP